jgi:membrane protein
MSNALFDNLRTSLKDMFRQTQDGEIRLVASALAFSTLLSLVPFIAVTLSIFKSIGGLEFLYPKVESFLLAYVEQGVGEKAILFVQKILQRVSSGALGTTGAVFLFFSSFKLIQDMERGVNRVWNVDEKRPFHRRIFLSLFLFVLFPMSLAVYAGFRSLNSLKPLFQTDFRILTDFTMVFGGLFLVYKVVPFIQVRTAPAIASALMAGIALVCLKNSFAWMAAKVFSYSKIYGSLAAVPLLCLWILGVWYIILGGVAFCASTQKRHWLEQKYGNDFRP